MDAQTWIQTTDVAISGIIEMAKEFNSHSTFCSSLGAEATAHDTEDAYVYYILTVAKGAWGNEAKFIGVARFLGMDSTDMDLLEDWTELEAMAHDICELLTAQAAEEGLTGQFYFDHNEADGDYDLFYKEDKEDVSTN
jgi:hypothetical protein